MLRSGRICASVAAAHLLNRDLLAGLRARGTARSPGRKDPHRGLKRKPW